MLWQRTELVFSPQLAHLQRVLRFSSLLHHSAWSKSYGERERDMSMCRWLERKDIRTLFSLEKVKIFDRSRFSFISLARITSAEICFPWKKWSDSGHLFSRDKPFGARWEWKSSVKPFFIVMQFVFSSKWDHNIIQYLTTLSFSSSSPSSTRVSLLRVENDISRRRLSPSVSNSLLSVWSL
jgi:hypothetical protein